MRTGMADCFGTTDVRRARLKTIVHCPACKTVIEVDPNRVIAKCPNPTCGERFAIDNPTFQRGGG